MTCACYKPCPCGGWIFNDEIGIFIGNLYLEEQVPLSWKIRLSSFGLDMNDLNENTTVTVSGQIISFLQQPG